MNGDAVGGVDRKFYAFLWLRINLPEFLSVFMIPKSDLGDILLGFNYFYWIFKLQVEDPCEK